MIFAYADPPYLGCAKKLYGDGGPAVSADDLRPVLQLRPYQVRMRDFMLAHRRCNLWASMGVGKTLVVLSALDILFLSGAETKPALIVAPLRVALNTWPDEARKWRHLLSTISVQPIVGTAAERVAALANRSANVFTINYENLPWLLAHLQGAWPFGRVVLDESTRLKSSRSYYHTNAQGKTFLVQRGGQRARALAQVERQCTGMTLLSGTPAPNGLIDLWGQCWFIDRGQRLGCTFGAFEARWFRQHPSGYGVLPLAHAQAEINERLADVSLSIDHDLPVIEPIANRIEIELPAKARKLYRDMEREMFAAINGHAIEAFNAAGRTIKTLAIASGFAYTNDEATTWTEVHDEKIRALESVVEEAAGAPVLVAYHFLADLDRLRRAFPRARVLDKNPATIRDWNAGRISMLLAHPASAGHGLNLAEGGNILVFFGLWWALEEHQQIVERVGPVRQAQLGLHRPVFIHYLVAKNTIDEDVLTRLHTKRTVQDILLESAKRRGE